MPVNFVCFAHVSGNVSAAKVPSRNPGYLNTKTMHELTIVYSHHATVLDYCELTDMSAEQHKRHELCKQRLMDFVDLYSVRMKHSFGS